VTSVADASLACATALIRALAVGGVRHACLSPGSRSTPLALALARDDRIAVHVHLDERSAGFFAVGLAKASGEPVAVACTSGTATAEYMPAVVEASQSRTPLLVLTADRPPRVRGTGANQTIDQRELYGRYARAFLETPVPTDVAQAPQWAEAGVRALALTQAPLAGPVHVNCPFDEPLVPDAGGTATVAARAHSDETAAEGGGDVVEAVGAFAAEYAGAHGVLTIGALPPPTTLALLSLGGVLGWPVLAEPLSGLRLDAGGAGRSLAAGQFLLGEDAWLDAHRPDVVVQAGAAPTTRAAQRLAAAADRLVVLDLDHLDPDPAGHAELRLRVDPERFAAAAWDGRETIAATEPRWDDEWRAADLVAHAAVDRALDGWAEPFEGRVARDLAAFLPHGATLVIGNSTPVRDLDTFMAPRRPPRIWTAPDLLRVIGNRGASGIDGLVSTALGVAAAGDRPTLALLGDLSFLYDAGALLWSSRLVGVDAVLVVVANGGGQIFAMLDQASLPELQELFVTPHPASIADVCRAAGVAHRPIERATDLQPTLERSLREGGVHVVEVRTDPSRDRDRRAELRAIVRDALARR
jgi:2-succinyl-5-enolpyruvyl-6-hydroxy-3-cyclohexene-1-carboxylate synthase